MSDQDSVWAPLPDSNGSGWKMIGLVFTFVQLGLVALVCAGMWGRPVILDNIMGDAALVVGACVVLLFGVNCIFVHETERLCRRRAENERRTAFSRVEDELSKKSAIVAALAENIKPWGLGVFDEGVIRVTDRELLRKRADGENEDRVEQEG